MQRFREFTDLRKTATGGQQPLVSAAAVNGPMPAVTNADQYRNRRFVGVNMGSWFVCEQWLCQSVFKNAASPQQSDLDICRGSNAQTNLQNHWDNWITTSDWQFIVNQGLNTIRLPIGYYHLSQSSIIANTDFAPYGTVFSGAWQRVLKAINTAASYGLGVLVDLHAAPGGQNNQPHSGTSSGVAGLWGNSTNLARTQQALNFLVQQLSNIDNVVGLELLNEPQNSDSLSAWYVSTIQTLRQFSSSFPLYIHDAFDPNYYAKFVGSRTDLGPIFQDTHYYRCFSSADTSENSDDIIQDVINSTNGMWSNVASWSNGKIIAGEWSAALAPSSLDQSARTQDSSRGYFAYVQLAMFRQDIAGGWMFWTIKKESGNDTGWSLENARSANTVPPDFSDYFVIPNGAIPSIPEEEETTNVVPVNKQATMRAALKSFQAKLAESPDFDYAAAHGRPNANPVPPSNETHEAQSQLFQQGFEVGFEDAQTFARGIPSSAAVNATSGSTCKSCIGFVNHWKNTRASQFLDAQDKAAKDSLTMWQKLFFSRRGSTTSKEARLAAAWEFTDGMDAGIRAVQDANMNSSGQTALEKWSIKMKDSFDNEGGKVKATGTRSK